MTISGAQNAPVTHGAVRAAEPADAAELVRLRRLMFAAMHGSDEPGAWERNARDILRRELAATAGAAEEDGPGNGARDAEGDGDAEGYGPGSGGSRLGAFVVDGAGPHLAACAVGTVEERLPAPAHPAGRFGFIFNVCTDTRYRGRGYGRATTEALLGWFAEQGVTRVDLHASENAELLYRTLGFTEHSTALSLDLGRRG